MKKTARKILSLAKYPLMIGLMWYLVSSGRLDFHAVARLVESGNVFILILILCMLFASHLLFARRYQLFTRIIGYNPRFSSIFKIIMIGVFYNNFLPGGTGGDLMRIYYLRRKEGIPVITGTATTIMDRILGLLGLVFVAGLSLVCVSLFTENANSIFKEQKILLLLTLSVPAGIVAGLLLLRAEPFFLIIEKILAKIIFGRQMLSFMETFRIFVGNTKALIRSLGLCVTGHIINIAVISIIAYVLYGSSAMYVTIGAAGIVLLTSAVPVTPGNIGLTEWLADSLYRLSGVEGGATVFIMWRIVMLLFSFGGGILYLISFKNIKPDKEDVYEN